MSFLDGFYRFRVSLHIFKNYSIDFIIKALKLTAAPIYYDTDELLLIAAGDEHAFERLFMACKDRVFEIGFIYTESRMLAEEIVQDVFIKVWLKRDELPLIKNFAGWLFTVARNQAFNCLRSRNNRDRAMQEMMSHVPGTAKPADEKLNSAQVRRLITEAMDLLSAQQRQVFQLIRIEGLSREEAAQRMGLSPNTIKVHLNIGLKTIRAYLLKNGAWVPVIILLYPLPG